MSNTNLLNLEAMEGRANDCLHGDSLDECGFIIVKGILSLIAEDRELRKENAELKQQVIDLDAKWYSSMLGELPGPVKGAVDKLKAEVTRQQEHNEGLINTQLKLQEMAAEDCERIDRLEAEAKALHADAGAMREAITTYCDHANEDRPEDWGRIAEALDGTAGAALLERVGKMEAAIRRALQEHNWHLSRELKREMAEALT